MMMSTIFPDCLSVFLGKLVEPILDRHIALGAAVKDDLDDFIREIFAHKVNVSILVRDVNKTNWRNGLLRGFFFL